MPNDEERRLEFRIPGTMRRLGVGDALAILFVIAGGIPIVLWIGSWLYHSATREQIVQGAVIIGMLYVALWIRKRFLKR